MKIECIPIMNLKKHGATCQLLILDKSLHILLDCGLNQKLDFQRYNIYWKQYLHKINIILLSHTGVEYTGALPFILDKLQDNVPQIFCTSPIKKFGFFNLYDAFLNIICSQTSQTDKKYNNEKFFQNIYNQFELCEEIKFQQNHKINLPKNIFNKEIIISCQGIGNTLGACAWTIKCNLINIMYLVTYNHYQELHLSGIDFKQLLKTRIDVLVTDSNHNETQDPIAVSSIENRNLLKQEIKQRVQQILDNNGILIIACYPNERIAEIVFLLHELFKEEPEIFETYKVDFYRNYKQYLEAFKMQSSFMSMQAEQLIQQPFQSPFLQKEVEDEERRKIQPFLNVRQDLLPDNIDLNKIVLTTYNVMFIGPLYQFLLNNAKNANNQLMIIGRPEQELYEATIKIKTGFQGILQLERGQRDLPKLNALENYIIKDKQKLEIQNKDDQFDNGNTETDFQTLVSKVQTVVSGPTLIQGQQENKQQQQQQQQFKEKTQEEILQALNENPQSYRELQQQLEEEYDIDQELPDFNESQQNLQQQQQQQQQSQQIQQVGYGFDDFADIQDRETFQKSQKEVLFQHQKQFPRFHTHPQKITFTEYGHDTEGEIQGKLRTDNVANLVKQGQVRKQNSQGKREVANQLFLNFVSQDMLNQQCLIKQDIQFNMSVTEYPLKGISDFKSAVNIISLIDPKHIILVNGQKIENQYMKQELQKKFQENKIYLPDLADTIATFNIENESLDIENFSLKENIKEQLPLDNVDQLQIQALNSQNLESEIPIYFKKVKGEVILKFYKESKRTEISLNLVDKNYKEQQQLEDEEKFQQNQKQQNMEIEPELTAQEKDLKQKQIQENQIFERNQELLKNAQNMNERDRIEALQNLNKEMEAEEQEEIIQELETINLMDQQEENPQNQEIQEKKINNQNNNNNQQDKNSEFYGDFKFEQLVQNIVEQKIKCSISSGKLSLFDGQVQIIRKDNQFSIEGVYCPEYFTVRKLLFNFLQQSVQL